MTVMFPLVLAVGFAAAIVGAAYELFATCERRQRRILGLLAVVLCTVAPSLAPSVVRADADGFMDGGVPLPGPGSPIPLPGQDLANGIPAMPGMTGTGIDPGGADPFVGTGDILAANPGAVGQPGTLWAVTDQTLAAVTMTELGPIYDVIGRLPEEMPGDGGFTGIAAAGHILDAGLAGIADPLITASPSLMVLQAALDAKAREDRRLAMSPRNSGPVGPPVDPADTVVVAGFRVHKDLAAQTEALISAARADGINLGGGAYRSTESQIALRRAHCGTSDYDIYEKPSKECSPQTARPGRSMHERGKAFDFTCNGGSYISTRDSVCFRWLEQNAGGFVVNLPAEPWHWSTNGQ